MNVHLLECSWTCKQSCHFWEENSTEVHFILFIPTSDQAHNIIANIYEHLLCAGPLHVPLDLILTVTP